MTFVDFPPLADCPEPECGSAMEPDLGLTCCALCRFEGRGQLELKVEQPASTAPSVLETA